MASPDACSAIAIFEQAYAAPTPYVAVAETVDSSALTKSSRPLGFRAAVESAAGDPYVDHADDTANSGGIPPDRG